MVKLPKPRLGLIAANRGFFSDRLAAKKPRFDAPFAWHLGVNRMIVS